MHCLSTVAYNSETTCLAHIDIYGAVQGIYEYGDHGGLLLMASHETEGPAESLQFSLDQGACWHTIHLSEAIDIQNIR